MEILKTTEAQKMLREQKAVREAKNKAAEVKDDKKEAEAKAVNSRSVKQQRFGNRCHIVDVSIRDFKKRIPVRGGAQNFKWLGFTAKFFYGQKHKFRAHPDQFVVTRVINRDTKQELMPLQKINGRLTDGSRVEVEIAARSQAKQTWQPKSMWYAVAHTHPTRWVFVTLKPSFRPDPLNDIEHDPNEFELVLNENNEYEARKKITVRLWTNLDGWHEAEEIPIVTKKRGEKVISRVSARLMMPPTAELHFYFEVGGQKHFAHNYKKKRVRKNGLTVEVNYYSPKVRPHLIPDKVPYPRTVYSDGEAAAAGARLSPVPGARRRGASPGAPEADGPRRKKKKIKFELVDPITPEELVDMFNFDWSEIQLNDIVPNKKSRDELALIIEDNFSLLRDTFQYLSGISAPVEYMTSHEFLVFCRDTKLIAHSFSTTLCSVLFRRVNVMEMYEDQPEDGQPGDGKSEGGFTFYEDESNPDNLFVRSEWIESLVRIADYWNLAIPLAEKFERVVELVRKRWAKEVDKELLSARKMIAEDMSIRKAFDPYLYRVFKVFEKYAGLGRNVQSSKPELQWSEYVEFVQDFSLHSCSASMNRRFIAKLVAYSQGASLADERGYLTEFPEFLEMLVRYSVFAYPNKKPALACTTFLDYVMEKAILNDVSFYDDEEERVRRHKRHRRRQREAADREDSSDEYSESDDYESSSAGEIGRAHV